MEYAFDNLEAPETYFLLRNSNSEFDSLFKFTFMNLILKKVIRVGSERKQAHPREKSRTIVMVSKGEEFYNQTPRPYEFVFTNYLEQKPRTQFPILSYMGEVAQNTLGTHQYLEDRFRSLQKLQPYLANSVRERLAKEGWLTEEGELKCKGIVKDLKATSQQLSSTGNHAPDLIQNLKSNILLLWHLSPKPRPKPTSKPSLRSNLLASPHLGKETKTVFQIWDAFDVWLKKALNGVNFDPDTFDQKD